MSCAINCPKKGQPAKILGLSCPRSSCNCVRHSRGPSAAPYLSKASPPTGRRGRSGKSLPNWPSGKSGSRGRSLRRACGSAAGRIDVLAGTTKHLLGSCSEESHGQTDGNEQFSDRRRKEEILPCHNGHRDESQGKQRDHRTYPDGIRF